MASKLYFNHIPKTAGSTVRKWLQAQPGMHCAPVHLWSELLALPAASLDAYSLFAGHFYRPFHRYVRFDLAAIVFLRNPIDRSISHFEHIRRSPEHYHYKRVERHGSFLEFVLDPVTRPMVESFQVRALVNDFDAAELAQSISPLEDHPFGLERTIESLSLTLNGAAALDVAKDYLMQCAFVGLAERVHLSLSLLAAEMGWPACGPIGRENVNPQRQLSGPMLSDRELEAITDATRLDSSLYEFGRGLFDSRLLAVSVDGIARC